MKLPETFFITGTDTDVGKTLISAILLRATRGTYWKPIQSGTIEATDTTLVKALTALPDSHFAKETHRLTQPLSPHASARIDGVEITVAAISKPKAKHSPLIIEGAGGVLVPLNDEQMVVDLIKHLAVPALVVARSGLGTINHTLLTLEALRRHDIDVLGVIMNGEPNQGNKEAIERYGRTTVLAEVPPLGELSRSKIEKAAEHLNGLQIELSSKAGAKP